MSDWHLKQPHNKSIKGHEKKTTVDKRVLTRRVCDVLRARMDSDPDLKTVDTEVLLKFLQAVTPKEHNVKHDTNITYISQTPRPLAHKNNSQVIDITPHTSRIPDQDRE